ncbi:ferredoxin reductase [Pseudomonas aeruginosa]|nr:ferredoxin reductase [Pseudomonas aeruginosa]
MALLPLALLTPLLAPLRRLAARGWLREADVDGLLRHAHPLASLNRHYARVEARYWVADDMLALALRTAPGWPPARPGQHIQLLAERDGVRVGRSYSLTRVVGERLEIAVKRHPDGLLSPWLCEHLAVGQRVEVPPAQGDLRGPMQAEAVCLLAAGSGLTPLLGLLREALENGYRGPVLWLHYVRPPGQRAWLGEREALAARHPNRELRWSLPRGARADGCLEGHFQPRHLDGWAADLARSQALACGPAAFVEAVGEQLGARFAGLQTESFSVPRWRSGEAPREVRLRFARSQREVSGDSAASLLEPAEAPGLRPAHGCRPGICASCTCVLLSGGVRDLRSGALCSEPGQPIRLCVSAAHGDLALDLGTDLRALRCATTAN